MERKILESRIEAVLAGERGQRVGAIDRMIEEQHLLMHRFYQHWQKGKVTPEVLRSYAVQYYAYESALPKFLEQAMATFRKDRPLESLKGQPGDEAAARDAPRAVAALFSPRLRRERQRCRSANAAGTANLVYTYESLCDRGRDEALAALYAYESQFPSVCGDQGGGCGASTASRRRTPSNSSTPLDAGPRHAAGLPRAWFTPAGRDRRPWRSTPGGACSTRSKRCSLRAGTRIQA